MAKKARTTKNEDQGNHLCRGDDKIDLEKVEDRFTLIPSSREQLAELQRAPGVRDIGVGVKLVG